MNAWSIVSMALLAGAAFGQTLPPPHRTVYRCEEAGKVRYSDAPCLGATKVDVEPTRGLNQSTGRPLTGTDVQREVRQERMAEAIQPLTGTTADQFKRAVRRERLSPQAQQQCTIWDRELIAAEASERTARQETERTRARQRVFELRSELHKAGCN